MRGSIATPWKKAFAQINWYGPPEKRAWMQAWSAWRRPLTPGCVGTRCNGGAPPLARPKHHTSTTTSGGAGGRVRQWVYTMQRDGKTPSRCCSNPPNLWQGAAAQRPGRTGGPLVYLGACHVSRSDQVLQSGKASQQPALGLSPPLRLHTLGIPSLRWRRAGWAAKEAPGPQLLGRFSSLWPSRLGVGGRSGFSVARSR